MSGSMEEVVSSSTGSVALACISSSSRTECGHGRWTFSQALLEGLRGEPYVDLNHDGNITIDEIARHIRHDIKYYENNHSVYAKSTGFNGDLVMARTKETNTKEPEPVKVWYEGQWWKARLMERDGNQGRIRWIQLGYDAPSDDVWVSMSDVKPITEPVD